MDPETTETMREVESKVILHWNYRELAEFPEVMKTHGGHVREMYLKWNRLTVLPSWIVELRNLTNLYISDNLIAELPGELGEMNQLTVLDLSGNRLGWVPSCIGNLNNLRTLLLNNNFIEKLPAELRQLSNLEVLSISSNRIIALPEWIGSLPRLRELYIDNNRLKELPNRLTLAPELTTISVCLNSLRYLPLNGFLSAPYIRFNVNDFLNYISYPLLFQLLSRLRTTFVDNRGTLAYGCFKSHDDALNTNIKLYVEMKGFYEKDADVTIELPRQLLKIHGVHENATCSLVELALRKVYTERFKHTLDVTVSPPNATVLYEPLPEALLDLTVLSTDYMFSLLTNGPASICVNSQCQQPIFTEAWVTIGISFHAEMITIVLCCSKSCAIAFAIHSSTTITTLDWHSIN